MLSPKYLVALVVDKVATEKAIYFLPGKWKNFWSTDIIDSKGNG